VAEECFTFRIDALAAQPERGRKAMWSPITQFLRHRKTNALLITGLLITALLIGGVSDRVALHAQGPISSGTKITVDNVGQVKELARLGRGTITDLRWSSDGKAIVLLGSLGIWLYAADDLQAEPRLLEIPIAREYCVALSPDRSLLASGGEDGTVRVWDAKTGQSKAVLMGHTGPVFSVAPVYPSFVTLG
jgi:hypothetical protein